MRKSLIGLLVVAATSLTLIAQEALTPGEQKDMRPASHDYVGSEQGEPQPPARQEAPPPRPARPESCVGCIMKQREINDLKERIAYLEEQLRVRQTNAREVGKGITDETNWIVISLAVAVLIALVALCAWRPWRRRKVHGVRTTSARGEALSAREEPKPYSDAIK